MGSRNEALKTIGSVLSLVAISLLLLLGLSALFQPKDTSEEAGMIDASANAIMAEPADTIDVLFIGDSEAYSAISPLQLWGEHGITSYVCSAASIRLPYANQLLQIATQNQRPRVVIFETNMLFTVFSIDDLVTKELEGLLPIVRFHDRWKNITSENPFKTPEYSWTDDLKGFRISTTVSGDDNPSLVGETRTRSLYISATGRLYLSQMVDYCRSIGATPVFLSTPTLINWAPERHASIQAVADELGVAFIDLNVAPYIVEIDWDTETRDGGDHVNSVGAQKTTARIGDWLSWTFELEDHRGDASYQRWQTLYESYQAKLEDLG
ncbi:MAG: hypothetical protein IJH04_11970 [Eggerthellaceae bacterium]|nr:hypothetical protein [Eggerthellaceae bacterium]